MRLMVLSITVILLWANFPVSAAKVMTLTNVLADIGDLSAPTRATSRTIGRFSSTDPNLGPADHDHFLPGTTDDEAILAKMDGPGCIMRMWSALPKGTVNIYIDGKLVVDRPFTELFEDNYPFIEPICSKSSGGWYGYFPILYQNSCLVTSKGYKADGPSFYYQIDHVTYPSGTKVESFTGRSDGEERLALSKARHRLLNPDRSVRGERSKKKLVLQPGGTAEIYTADAPGTITRLEITPDEIDEPLMRGVVLRAWWDGEPTPSVECPLGDFFATVFQKQDFDSLYLGFKDVAFHSRFPMPYSTAVITLSNESERSVTLDWEVTTESGDTSKLLRFHAFWRRGTTVRGSDFEILRAEGRGNYVGSLLSMQHDGSGEGVVRDWPMWYLEGDETFIADGGASGTVRGTGTEDYFNCGWYYRGGISSRPFHGINVIRNDGKSTRYSQFRLHAPDFVSFSRSLEFTMEHGATNDVPGCDYSSVAYWYQAEPHMKYPLFPTYEGRKYRDYP